MLKVLKENKRVPLDVVQRVTRAGGFNRFGEPNFRVVWGWNRLTRVGGLFEDWEYDHKSKPVRFLRAVAEYREVPKYAEALDRWVIERWLAPEHFGSPEQFRARHRVIEDGKEFDELGAYPARGEYEHCFTLQTPQGDYLALTPSVVDYMVTVIERSRFLVTKNRAKSFEAIRRREQKKEADWDSYADDVLSDTDSAFGGSIWAPVAGLRPNPQIHV